MKNFAFTPGVKILLTVTLFTCGILVSSAQQGRLSIEEEAGIEALLELYKNSDSDEGYYTIQVGFGNYNRAERLKREVEVDFPSWYSRIIFDSPTYRVQLGKFRTKLDAERAFLEVRQKYPASLLLKPEKSRS